jgi:hypothetical protein
MASGRRTEVEEASLLGPDGPGDEGGETVSSRGAALLGAGGAPAAAAAGSIALLVALALVTTADEAGRSTGGTYSENI